ncbi:MAG: hypothetical protein M1816_006013 [Peltula sp. TS41687]|nr:MAG: hypothetical protein M1816_006013 [Peltula sp. TS41687]
MSSSSFEDDGILCEDLDKLGPEDLQERRVISLKDPENITAEQIQRLRHRIYGGGLSCPVDAKTLEEKLRGVMFKAYITELTLKASHETAPLTPYTDTEKLALTRSRRELLIQKGGRPRQPLPLGSCYCSPERIEARRDDPTIVGDGCWARANHNLDEELLLWDRFREHQRKVRETPEEFSKWQADVRYFREHYGLEGDVQLYPQLEQQSKVDEWKEFQSWFRVSTPFRLRLKELKEENKKQEDFIERCRKQLSEVESDESRWDVVRKYFKLLQDNGSLEREQRWEDYDPYDENAMLEHQKRKRRQRFQSAQNRLKSIYSALREEYATLEWVAQQLPLIASESAAMGHYDGQDDTQPPKEAVRSEEVTHTDSGGAEDPLEAVAQTEQSIGDPLLEREIRLEPVDATGPRKKRSWLAGHGDVRSAISNAGRRRSERIRSLQTSMVVSDIGYRNPHRTAPLKVVKASKEKASKGARSSKRRPRHGANLRPSSALSPPPSSQPHREILPMSTTPISRRKRNSSAPLRQSERIFNRIMKSAPDVRAWQIIKNADSIASMPQGTSRKRSRENDESNAEEERRKRMNLGRESQAPA